MTVVSEQVVSLQTQYVTYYLFAKVISLPQGVDIPEGSHSYVSSAIYMTFMPIRGQAHWRRLMLSTRYVAFELRYSLMLP